MRSVFYVFAGAGLLLLVLVNTSFLLGPTRPVPVFRAAASFLADVAVRSQEAAVEIELEHAQRHADAFSLDSTVAVATPLDFEILGAADADASSPAPATASMQVGTLSRECSSTPDLEHRASLRMVGGGRCVAGRPLCAALRRALGLVPSLSTQQRSRPTVVLTTFVGGQERMLGTLSASAAALRLPFVALALDAAGAAVALSPVAIVDLSRADALPSTSYIPGEARDTGAPPSSLGSGPLVAKWRAVAALLASGVTVLYLDVDGVLGADPFEFSFGDSDFEVLSEAWEAESARGFVMGSDDPSMGWSRYCETMAIGLLSPALFLAQPTFEAVAVARRMARLAHSWAAPAPGTAWEPGHENGHENGQTGQSGFHESEAFSFELLAPAHDQVSRVGASVRAFTTNCWLNARSALALLSSQRTTAAAATRYAALLPGRNAGGAERQAAAAGSFYRGEALGSSWSEGGANEKLEPRWKLERTLIDPMMRRQWQFEPTKSLVLKTKCAKLQPDVRRDTRPLNWVAPPDSAKWPVNCGASDNSRALCEVVKKVAVDRAVMAAVSNGNILHMLGQFVDIVKQVGVPNFLVVALDDRTKTFLDKKGCANYRRTLVARGGGTDNHATSSLKFSILHEMLSVGVSVLLSDVDIVITQNPFLALYRDTDVEGMTDGWDDATAYGHALSTAVPGSSTGPLRSFRLVARNSGLFYVAATLNSRRLMRILAERVAAENVWDQSAYNQEIFRLAHGSSVSPGVSVRTMNYMCFLNTKFLFKHMRRDKVRAFAYMYGYIFRSMYGYKSIYIELYQG